MSKNSKTTNDILPLRECGQRWTQGAVCFKRHATLLLKIPLMCPLHQEGIHTLAQGLIIAICLPGNLAHQALASDENSNFIILGLLEPHQSFSTVGSVILQIFISKSPLSVQCHLSRSLPWGIRWRDSGSSCDPQLNLCISASRSLACQPHIRHPWEGSNRELMETGIA